MIEIVPKTGSTNADLAARLSGGEYLPEGRWLIADRQTAGRGRLGRVWADGHGNFMGSTVVRTGFGDPAAASLSLMTGVAVHRALAECLGEVPALRIKWPNDLLLGHDKVAGILLEMVAGVVIVGIGVNLALAPSVPEREVSSFGDFPTMPSRDAFAQVLATAFDRELERWRSAGLAPLLRRWQDAAHPVGTPLKVIPPGEKPVFGHFAGLSPEGDLLLTLPDNAVRVVRAGDVVLERGTH